MKASELKERISSGKYDDRLLDIYADRERIERHLENKREMYLSTMPYAIERVKQLGQI